MISFFFSGGLCLSQHAKTVKLKRKLQIVLFISWLLAFNNVRNFKTRV